jgi:hypothetical protein
MPRRSPQAFKFPVFNFDGEIQGCTQVVYILQSVVGSKESACKKVVVS